MIFKVPPVIVERPADLVTQALMAGLEPLDAMDKMDALETLEPLDGMEIQEPLVDLDSPVEMEERDPLDSQVFPGVMAAQVRCSTIFLSNTITLLLPFSLNKNIAKIGIQLKTKKLQFSAC